MRIYGFLKRKIEMYGLPETKGCDYAARNNFIRPSNIRSIFLSRDNVIYRVTEYYQSEHDFVRDPSGVKYENPVGISQN